MEAGSSANSIQDAKLRRELSLNARVERSLRIVAPRIRSVHITKKEDRLPASKPPEILSYHMLLTNETNRSWNPYLALQLGKFPHSFRGASWESRKTVRIK